MKCNLEFNPTELRDAIISGSLIKLIERINNAETEIKQEAQAFSTAVSQAPAAQQNQLVQQPMHQTYQAPVQQPAQLGQAQPAYAQPTQQYAAPGQMTQQQTFPAMQQQPTPPATVPTAVQTYTLEQLSVAGTQLVDAGRMTELQQLLAGFGVNSMMQLPKEQYGTFATQLRAMGAKI